MCYDQRSSFISWIIGFVSGVLLFLRNGPNDRWISLFIITFTGIQLIEYNLWKSIDEKDKKHNERWTKIALLNLWAQSLSMTIGAFVWGKVTTGNKMWFKLLVIAFVFTLLFSIIAVNRVSQSPSNFKSFVGENGHLVWTEDYDPNVKSQHNFYFVNKQYPRFAQLIYMIGVMLPYLFMSQSSRAFYLASIVGLTSYFSYINFYETGEFSSMWCYYAVFYSLIAWLPIS